jgi:small neutral amino acid transporter SnatA (MarC family)
MISAIALLVLEGWIVFFSGILEMFGLAVPVMVSIGAIILAWLASHARRRDWLT